MNVISQVTIIKTQEANVADTAYGGDSFLIVDARTLGFDSEHGRSLALSSNVQLNR